MPQLDWVKCERMFSSLDVQTQVPENKNINIMTKLSGLSLRTITNNVLPQTPPSAFTWTDSSPVKDGWQTGGLPGAAPLLLAGLPLFWCFQDGRSV